MQAAVFLIPVYATHYHYISLGIKLKDSFATALSLLHYVHLALDSLCSFLTAPFGPGD
jgi:hypothetical protein